MWQITFRIANQAELFAWRHKTQFMFSFCPRFHFSTHFKKKEEIASQTLTPKEEEKILEESQQELHW